MMYAPQVIAKTHNLFIAFSCDEVEKIKKLDEKMKAQNRQTLQQWVESIPNIHGVEFIPDDQGLYYDIAECFDDQAKREQVAARVRLYLKHGSPA